MNTDYYKRNKEAISIKQKLRVRLAKPEKYNLDLNTNPELIFGIVHKKRCGFMYTNGPAPDPIMPKKKSGQVTLAAILAAYGTKPGDDQNPYQCKNICYNDFCTRHYNYNFRCSVNTKPMFAEANGQLGDNLSPKAIERQEKIALKTRGVKKREELMASINNIIQPHGVNGSPEGGLLRDQRKSVLNTPQVVN